MNARQPLCPVWALACALASSCATKSEGAEPTRTPEAERAWQTVIAGAPGALLRVVGVSSSELYAVGADTDVSGPVVYHLTDSRLERLQTGERGSLWWLHPTDDDTLQMVGDHGLVLSYQRSTGRFTRIPTAVEERLFGVWSAGPNDIWYVGGDLDKKAGRILHGDGRNIDAPAGLPEAALAGAVFKVTGFGADAIWMVGQHGKVVSCDGEHFVADTLPTPLPLLSVSGTSAEDLYAVGGAANGVILHRADGTWKDETPPGLSPLNAVWAVDEERAFAAGFNGHLYQRKDGAWHAFSPEPPTYQDLHSVWVDDEGGIWLAGGRLSVDPPTDGVLLYYGPRTWKAAQP